MSSRQHIIAIEPSRGGSAARLRTEASQWVLRARSAARATTCNLRARSAGFVAPQASRTAGADAAFRPTLALYVSVGLVAGAVIALQIALMRSFAVGIWAHFGALVVSLAMLGFGLASAVMCIAKSWFERNWRSATHLSVLLFGPLLVAASLVAQQIPFNAVDLVSDPAQKWRLIGNFLLYMLPFLAGAFFLGTVFLRAQKVFGRVYFADLTGSGLGGLLVLATMHLVTPENLLMVPMALWFAGSALWLVAMGHRRAIAWLGVVAAVSAGLHLAAPALDLPTLAVAGHRSVADLTAYVNSPDLLRGADLELLRNEWSDLLAWTTLLIACIAALSLVLLPLAFGWRAIFSCNPGKVRTIVYFACLGAGYIMVEVGLISKFIQALSNGIVSASVLITGMLVFSGLGSWVSERYLDRARAVMPRLFLAIGALLIGYGLALDRVLDWVGTFPYVARLLFCFALVFPPAFLMGFPMPVAMAWLSRLGKDHMFLWAWGINGCFSVVGAAMVPVIATSFGLAAVLLVSGCAYLLAILGFFAILSPLSSVVSPKCRHPSRQAFISAFRR